MIFLLEMTPTLYNRQEGGRWVSRTRDGAIYNRIEYVREMMKKHGDRDLSDEAVNRLWDYREILIKLHNERWTPKKELGHLKKLLFPK